MSVKVLFILLLSTTLYAQDKMAFVLGDDCHEKGPYRIGEFTTQASKNLAHRGYAVKTLFGSDKRSGELKKDLSNVGGVDVEPFSRSTIQKNLKAVYDLACESRPKQLMLNFIAHGSFNGGEHTLCGHKVGEDYINTIKVSHIAQDLAKLQKLKPECPYPKVAVVDTSCKSGATIEAFKGLGCSLSLTSTHNFTNMAFIQKYVDKLSSKKGIDNFSDMHLDLILNRDYELYETEFKNNKTTLDRIFENANQIAGCKDANAGGFAQDIFTKPEDISELSCNSTDILNLERNSEIREVKSIIEHFNFTEDSDQKKIASVLNIKESDLTKPTQLLKTVADLIDQDQISKDKSSKLLKEESEIFTHMDLNNKVLCRLSPPDFSKTQISNTERLALSNIYNTKNTANLEDKESLSKLFCYIHLDESQKGEMSRCLKAANSLAINISANALLKNYKDINKIEFQGKINKIKEILEIKRKALGINFNMETLLASYQQTLNDCTDSLSNSQEPKISKAASFLKTQYSKPKDGCSHENIYCLLQADKKRVKEIKEQLALARAYYYLQCKNKLPENNDLKACQDFKL